MACLGMKIEREVLNIWESSAVSLLKLRGRVDREGEAPAEPLPLALRRAGYPKFRRDTPLGKDVAECGLCHLSNEQLWADR